MKIVEVRTSKQLTEFLSLNNRSTWEEETTNEFFWPLKHQEACRDEDFDQRREWAFALCKEGRSLYWDHLDDVLEIYTPSSDGVLQDEVRNLITRVILRVVFGKELDLSLAQKALKEYDRRIKLTKLKDTQLRTTFVGCFSQHIKDAWIDPDPRSLLAIAKKNFPLSENLLHQLISVFMITGTIQLSDATIHCLLSSENFTQTMMKFPLNKFLTREGKNGEIYSLRPETFNKLEVRTGEGCGKWLFGDGPRRCPAIYFAPKFVEHLANFYREFNFNIADIQHSRSLDIDIPFSTENTPKISWGSKVGAKVTYWFNVCVLGLVAQKRRFWKYLNNPETYVVLIND